MNTDDKGFLERYHKMISDVESRPKIFQNLKQGDSFWYLCYSYRGNGNNKNEFRIAKYTVHELSEYCKDTENIDELTPKSYNIYVMREMSVRIDYSSNPADRDKIGKWRREVRPYGLEQLFKREYGDDMCGDIVVKDRDYDCEYIVVAFDKKKALKRMKAYVQRRADEQKKRFKAYIEKQQAEESKLEAEYDNILKEIENG